MYVQNTFSYFNNQPLREDHTAHAQTLLWDGLVSSEILYDHHIHSEKKIFYV